MAGTLGKDLLLGHEHRPCLDVLRDPAPLGFLQLYKSVNDGYFEARELEFLTNDTNTLIEWLRLPGDIVFIVGGAVPALYIAYLGIRHSVKRTTLDEPEDILFTEITEPPDVSARRGRGRGGGTRRAARPSSRSPTPWR